MPSKPYCTLPFVQFSTTVNGNYQACCIAEKQKENIVDMTPMDFFNGEHMKQLRYDMLQPGEPSDLIKKTCIKCITNETNSGNSKRLQNYYTTNLDKENILNSETLEKIKNNKNIDLEPTDMDSFKIKIFGNLCNLKCTMCNPLVSSKIAAEQKRLGTLPKEWKGPIVIDQSEKMDMDKFRDDLKKILPTTKQIEIVGGEPFLYPKVAPFIEWIVYNNLSRNLELRFVTNGMTINYELFSLFRHFKKVIVMFSLDGVGKVDEYIRTGTIWEEKVQNMKNIAMLPKVKLSFSTTVQLLNIGYLYEIYDFCRETFGIQAKLNNNLSYPVWAQAVNLPKSIANSYLEKYEDKKFFNKNHHLQTLKNDQERNPMRFKWAMDRYKYLDSVRNTNLIEIYPEFEKWYDKAQAKPWIGASPWSN
jgi:MoaA/NifB/PqqE/SkfB family radical SAM enzyme|tara:strand:+ start:674 stop:1924 length:1251 start_codon:yes stop_codon:yes gene_type:complete